VILETLELSLVKSKIIGLALLLLFPFISSRAQYRTVIDKEVGAVFQTPGGFSYGEYGAFIGSAPTGSLDPSALSVLYARFDVFSTSDNTMVRGFPYSALRTYESQQVAAGKAPIFITATYAGKVRPVYFSWSLGLVNGVPTAPSSAWQYAVNVQDPRYVNFWINNYLRPIVWKVSYAVPNVWFELDECAFNFGLYGVLDDTNHFVAGVTWDSPFPQTGTAYLNSVGSFFSQLKALAPDIKTMPNVGTMSDPTQFQPIFANVPGALAENIYSWHASPTSYTRNAWYQQTYSQFSWFGAQGKVGILRAVLPTGDSNALLTSFVVYSLLKGPNFFFAPGSATAVNPNPSEWMGWKSALGGPTANAMSTQESSAGIGYRMYMRQFKNGAVYLNLTGSTQVIQLDARYKHWDPNGNVVTQISIPDTIGTFVVTEPNVLEAPGVSPRFSATATDPMMVTITNNTPGATIRYTTTGTAPTTSSPIYTGPFEISGNAIVQAGAYQTGSNPSWPSAASYTVSAATPTVQFTSESYSGPAGSYFPVLALSAIPNGIVTVSYTVQTPTGAITTGTASFLPGNIYRYFPITVSGAVGTVTTVTINSVTGAGLGSTSTLSYTVQ
jgi:Fn3 associated